MANQSDRSIRKPVSSEADRSVAGHWNDVYLSTPVDRLGWYESVAEPSLRLIDRTGIGVDDRILDIGTGASTLIDSLVERGYRNIVASDISGIALERARLRIGPDAAGRVRWVVDDVTRPSELGSSKDVALWHDRAMLHFLLSDTEQRAYRDLLGAVLKPGGWVVIAAFSTAGARRCSGLDVRNYDVDMLSNYLGQDFECIEHFDHVYEMPSGDLRPYVYTLFHHLLR